MLVGAGAFLGALGATFAALRWARAPVGPAGSWRPFATVIVPCKGEHPGFADNVRALAGQDYPAYELLFVVDAKDDPCAMMLDRLRAEGLRFRVLLAAPDEVGADWATGKVVAQLTGVARAAADSTVLVFADADARPTPRWLACLVAPLEDPGIGGVTGYRWYRSDARPTLWTAVRDAWNAVGLDAMTMPQLRFLWGGSMAVRRADFARSDVRARWRWTVSEDVGLTRAMRGLGLGLAFAPGAIVASPEDWSPAQVREWVVRQTALTRHALPGLYAFAWAVYALSVVLLVLGAALVLAWPGPTLGLAGLGMLAPVLSAVPRAAARMRLVARAHPGALERPAARTAVHLALGVAMPLVMLGALARARRVREVVWRGRAYLLTGGGVQFTQRKA